MLEPVNMHRSFAPTRAAFVPDRHTRNSQDSAFSSHHTSSIMQDSQSSDLVFSQVATQDKSSSQSASEILTEGGQNSSKKMSMYEKWLNKRASGRRDPTYPNSADCKPKPPVLLSIPSETIAPTTAFKLGTNNHNSMANKPLMDSTYLSLKGVAQRSKAVERDERDLLEQVTKTLQDCNSEVKATLYAVTDKLENLAEMSNEQLAQTVTTFLGDIWKHQEKLRELVQDQNKKGTSLTDLEVKLSRKESQVAMLEEQLMEVRKTDISRYATAVRNEMQSPHLAVQQKLEEILECARDTKEQHSHYLSENKRSMDSQWKQYQSQSRTEQKNLKELEKRIIADIRKMLEKQESRQAEFQQELKDDLRNWLETYTAEITKVTADQIQHNISQHISAPQNVRIVQRQTSVIQDAMKKQFEMMSKSLVNALENQRSERDQKLTDTRSIISENIRQTVESLKTDRGGLSSSCDVLAQVDSRLANFQSVLRKQLMEMEENHSSVIKEMGRNLCTYLTNNAANSRPEEIMQNVATISSVDNMGSVDRFQNVVTVSNSAMHSQLSRNVRSISAGPRYETPSSTALFQHLENRKGSSHTSASESKQLCRTDPSENRNISVPFHMPSIVPSQHDRFARGISSMTPLTMPQQTSSQGLDQLGSTVKDSQRLIVPTSLCHQYQTSYTSRTGPSPIAAVRPQRHQTSGPGDHIIPHQAQKQHQDSNAPTTSNQRKRRKRKSICCRKKRTTRSRHYVVEEDTAILCAQRRNKPSDQEKSFNCHNLRSTKLDKYESPGKHMRPDFQYTKDHDGVCKKDERAMERHRSSLDQGSYLKRSRDSKPETFYQERISPSVYDFYDSDPGNLQMTTRKRKEPEDLSESMSLASFIDSRFLKKTYETDRDSKYSSPSISITKMTIKRQIRTPFRRGSHFCSKPNIEDHETLSPAPTLLSAISSRI